jgi:hypothetical protein
LVVEVYVPGGSLPGTLQLVVRPTQQPFGEFDVAADLASSADAKGVEAVLSVVVPKPCQGGP